MSRYELINEVNIITHPIIKGKVEKIKEKKDTHQRKRSFSIGVNYLKMQKVFSVEDNNVVYYCFQVSYLSAHSCEFPGTSLLVMFLLAQ